jgi:hypothetical protein
MDAPLLLKLGEGRFLLACPQAARPLAANSVATANGSYAPVIVLPAVLRSSQKRTLVLVAQLRCAGRLSAA